MSPQLRHAATSWEMRRTSMFNGSQNWFAPEDELDGGWTREQLEAMNARFIAALEQAFLRG